MYTTFFINHDPDITRNIIKVVHFLQKVYITWLKNIVFSNAAIYAIWGLATSPSKEYSLLYL